MQREIILKNKKTLIMCITAKSLCSSFTAQVTRDLTEVLFPSSLRILSPYTLVHSHISTEHTGDVIKLSAQLTELDNGTEPKSDRSPLDQRAISNTTNSLRGTMNGFFSFTH